MWRFVVQGSVPAPQTYMCGLSRAAKLLDTTGGVGVGVGLAVGSVLPGRKHARTRGTHRSLGGSRGASRVAA